MDKEATVSAINSKYEELKNALESDDLLKIRELSPDLNLPTAVDRIMEKER